MSLSQSDGPALVSSSDGHPSSSRATPDADVETETGHAPSFQEVAPSITSHPLPDSQVVLEAIINAQSDDSEDTDRNNDEASTPSFQFAPSIAPPLPDIRAIMEVLTDPEKEDDEKKERSTKKAVKDRPADPSGAGESNNIRDREPSNLESQINDNEAGNSSCGPGNERPTSNDIRGEYDIEENAPTIRRNSTIVYGGSDARVQVASPFSQSDVTASDPQSIIYSSNSPIRVPDAYLVQSRMSSPIAVHAEPVQPWYKRPSGKIMILTVILLVCALVVIAMFVSQNIKGNDEALSEPSTPTLIFSSVPSVAPSFDTMPTLEIVRSRGEIRCGLGSFVSNISLTQDLCSAVASVVLGDPNKTKHIIVTAENRYIKLNEREIDLLIWGDSYTLGREISEASTGVGFAFSQPYAITGTVYAGQKYFVDCADTMTRFGNCTNLKICVRESTNLDTVIESRFPSSTLVRGYTADDLLDMFNQGLCNVILGDIFWLRSTPILNDIASSKYVFGHDILSFKPLSVVMRDTNIQWIDIVNGVVEGVLRGAWNGVAAQDLSLCPVGSSNPLNINFLNAPICVGNIYELSERLLSSSDFTDAPFLQDLSSITGNATGAIYAPGFGSLDCSSCTDALKRGTLANIKKREKVNCGVINDPSNKGLTAMSEIYCRAIAVAIFHGDITAVNIIHIEQKNWIYNESLQEFSDGMFDVIAGESRFGLSGWWSPDLSSWDPQYSGNFQFTVPYYYQSTDGGGIGKEISLVTRGNDTVFSSFVNSIVTATINAVQNDRTNLNSMQMPFIGLFGEEMKWMFHDVIHNIGNYDDIYYNSHGIKDGENDDRMYNKVMGIREFAMRYWWPKE